MRRRDFLLDLARYSVLCAGVPGIWRVTGRPHLLDDPFTLGVASGDPAPNGAMIWTRLAPRLLESDGGMDGQRAAVNWEVAEDEQFSKIVQKGRATAAPELGYSIHVDVPGLLEDRWYYYRFTLPAGSSPVGRLRTTPADGAVTPLRFAFASCQHYENGYYTAYEHMAREDLDLVAHLGDYIYEYGGADGRVRKYATAEVRTLDQYRARYAQTKSDQSLQRAHARCPWVVTWDDHEVDNDYAGLSGENMMESEEQMHDRRAAAYQAWWEHQPVRVPRARGWADLAITRTINWGALARFWVLDTRQYRTKQACGNGLHDAPCGDWADPTRTIMGPAQEQWLSAGLPASRALWQVFANQVTVAPFDQTVGPARGMWMDSWSGYPASLEKLMALIARHAENRAVVLTGDIHSNWVSELRRRYEQADAPTIGAEFVGTSISSGGDGADNSASWTSAARAENPHYKWNNARRGYVTCNVTGDEWKTSYRTIPFITKPDAPVATASEWLVRRGKPGIERV
ncbi:MAG: alkaline phosphatase [Gemmatimonadetes bacterium]|nr:alkaline phosphatase [Gemmatimonadota bacterium]